MCQFFFFYVILDGFCCFVRIGIRDSRLSLRQSIVRHLFQREPLKETSNLSVVLRALIVCKYN